MIKNYHAGRKIKRVNEELKQLIESNGLTYHIETFGCQMNVHESEKIAGVLENLGYKPSESKAAPTCCYLIPAVCASMLKPGCQAISARSKTKGG